MTRHDDDLRLVERVLAGDEEAFDAFGERCLPAAYRFTLARLRGDHELAREIVQRVMVKALAGLAAYRGDASLATWLCACCRNEILMDYRQRRSAPFEVGLDEEVAAAALVTGGDDAEAGLLRREGAELVHVALDLLPDHYSRALEWMYVDGLPVREIADRLEIGPKAAESLLTRARAAFRQAWDGLREGMGTR